MTEKAVQDCYLEEFAHCYGCGRLNPDGMQIKRYCVKRRGHCPFPSEIIRNGESRQAKEEEFRHSTLEIFF